MSSGGLAQLVECALCKREAPGSKPGFSSWSYSVAVITLDFESSDPGSNPGRTWLFFSSEKTFLKKKLFRKSFTFSKNSITSVQSFFLKNFGEKFWRKKNSAMQLFLWQNFFFKTKKHTAPTIPVWSPTTVLGRPNPAWLQSSDGIWYIQGGMTVWWKKVNNITFI